MRLMTNLEQAVSVTVETRPSHTGMATQICADEKTGPVLRPEGIALQPRLLKLTVPTHLCQVIAFGSCALGTGCLATTRTVSWLPRTGEMGWRNNKRIS